MSVINLLKSASLTRRVTQTAIACSLVAASCLCATADAADGTSPYVSSYSTSSTSATSNSKPLLGISQYQEADQAAAYQYAASNAANPQKTTQTSSSQISSEEIYSTSRRYSSLTNAAPTQAELEARYGASSANAESDSYPIGSDAYFDAKTRDAKQRDASSSDDVLNATSGLGSTRKTHSTGVFGYAVETNARDGDTFEERWIEPDVPKNEWSWQLMPQGLMYPSYLAGRKEPRLQSIIAYTEGYGTLWDITLGGRAPIFRYGTSDVVRPEGWEIELEGAALLRLDWERQRNLAATDYRAGVPIVYGTKRWQFKTGYYHVSSHLGDNYLLDHFRKRIHYVRDAIMCGFSLTPTDEVRLYSEIDYAFHVGKTTDPVELQFGLEYTPKFDPNANNWVGRPFLASHAHLYQESDFGGYWATQLGMQWRGQTNSLMRVGAEYFMGRDDEYQFHKNFQRKYGFGFWYDF